MSESSIDPEEIIALVKERPPLYDTNLKEYYCQDIINQMWSEIAMALNCPVNRCKAKWRCLRTLYVRSVRNTNGGKKHKKWYLADAMTFVLPYILGGPQREESSLHLSIPGISDDSRIDETAPDFMENEGSIEWVVDENDETNPLDTASNSFPTNSNDAKRRKLSPSTSEAVNTHFDEYLRNATAHSRNQQRETGYSRNQQPETGYSRNQQPETEDPIIAFFKSLMPDIIKLDSRRQRHFKAQVIGVLNSMLDSQEDAEMAS
nr:PREDICTED: uncharacterized protein LOC109041584 [Bemisia tabaci]